MKTINILIVAVIALVSIAAGVAKVMQVPAEMEFLQGLGLTLPLIMAFGVGQVIAGALLVWPKTRVPGCVVAIIGFSLSTALIFISGDTKFGVISILPIILAAVILLPVRNSDA